MNIKHNVCDYEYPYELQNENLRNCNPLDIPTLEMYKAVLNECLVNPRYALTVLNSTDTNLFKDKYDSELLQRMPLKTGCSLYDAFEQMHNVLVERTRIIETFNAAAVLASENLTPEQRMVDIVEFVNNPIATAEKLSLTFDYSAASRQLNKKG